ncbi:hypothetical protein DITRI_Ditri12bG0189100 [Diplodiscus trichospermus]
MGKIVNRYKKKRREEGRLAGAEASRGVVGADEKSGKRGRGRNWEIEVERKGGWCCLRCRYRWDWGWFGEEEWILRFPFRERYLNIGKRANGIVDDTEDREERRVVTGTSRFPDR